MENGEEVGSGQGMNHNMMLNSIEMLRDEYLNELPKSINIQSNQDSGANK